VSTILFIRLDGFYTGVVWPDERPQVVHSHGLAVECCPRAQARGLRAGAPLSEARAVLRGEGAFREYSAEACLPFRDAWLGSLLPYSVRIMPGMPHEAWVDLAGHPDPAWAAGEALASLAAATPCHIAAGLAGACWVARLAARPCSRRALALALPAASCVDSPRAFLAPRPVADLSPVSPKARERLAALGCRTVGEAAAMPYSSLRTQFGPEAPVVEAASQGRWPDPVVPTFPSESMEEAWTGLGPIEDSYVLEEVLGILALRLGAGLAARGRTAGELALGLEGSGMRHWCSRKLAKPASSSGALKTLLVAMLARKRPSFAPETVRATALGLQPVGGAQAGLWCDKARDAKALSASLGLLRASYGEGSVRKASEIPLPRRMMVLAAWRDANGWR
jgi:nucleotidyltransferase/DNA polymerase involved in DNA repair